VCPHCGHRAPRDRNSAQVVLIDAHTPGTGVAARPKPLAPATGQVAVENPRNPNYSAAGRLVVGEFMRRLPRRTRCKSRRVSSRRWRLRSRCSLRRPASPGLLPDLLPRPPKKFGEGTRSAPQSPKSMYNMKHAPRRCLSQGRRLPARKNGLSAFHRA